MGVHGLWQLLNSTGKPVPLESLEGKVLAVDVSVWLHQLSKGMRDAQGNPLPHAHLHGLFTRICKLLYYRIKPVFVFDGGVPELKRQTLASRRDKREDAERSSSQMQQKILTNLIRSQALRDAYGVESAPNFPSTSKSSSARGSNKDTIFQLPPLPEASKLYLSQKSSQDATITDRLELQQMVEDQFESVEDIDVDSSDFKSLPPEIQHEVITDIRLRRKNYNLSKIVELPEDSKDFSQFQMSKLVKHNRLNTRLDQIRKDLNERQTKSLSKQYGASFGDLDTVYSQRMVSEDSAHYILAKRNLKQKKENEEKEKIKSKLKTKTVGYSEAAEHVKGFVDEFVESEEEKSSLDDISDSGIDWDSYTGDKRKNTSQGNKIGVDKSDLLASGQARTTRSGNRTQKEDGNKRIDIIGKNVGADEPTTEKISGVIIGGDKPRFRPVIEIESGSESDSDISEGNDDDSSSCSRQIQDMKQTDDDVIVVEESFDHDEALQMAIAESLKEQTHTRNDTTIYTKSDVSVNPDGPSECETLQPQRHSMDRDTAEQPYPKQDNVLSKAETETDKSAASNAVDSADIIKSLKNEQKLTKKRPGPPLKSTDNQATIKDLSAKIPPMKSSTRLSILKRKMSCLSDEGKEGADETGKKIKIIVSSDEEAGVSEDEEAPVVKVTEAGKSSESDSEDDFIEVRVDPAKIVEDDLFPASLFETKHSTGAEERQDVAEPKCKKIKLQHEDSVPVNVLGKPDLTGDTSITIEHLTHLSTVPIQEDSVLISDKIEQVLEGEGTDIDDNFVDSKKTHDTSSDTNKLEVSKSNEVYRHQSSSINNSEKTTEADATLAADTMVTGDSEVSQSFSAGSDHVADDNVEDNWADDSEVSQGSQLMPDIIESTGRQDSPLAPDLVRQFESLNENSIRALSRNITEETRQLRQEQGRQERLAVSITDQMHTEAQELLELFGIPYIVSPTEAEAQCAFLELSNLTHGTITDDSDIWLFGGKCVFKNFFNQQKHVECYKDVHITSQLGLVRDTMIQLALLCGSDYTDGIRGVGPVIAMEILAEFPGHRLEGLVKLKSWWDEAQKQIKIPSSESKLHAKLRDLHIRDGFPSQVVVDAYLSPRVDESTEKFSWGLPDLNDLRKFAGERLGWDQKKTDEILLPVLKRLSEKRMQRSIQAFFQPEIYMQPAKVKSKRLQNVVNKIKYPDQQKPGNENDTETDKQDTDSQVHADNSKGRKDKGKGRKNGTRNLAKKGKDEGSENMKKDTADDDSADFKEDCETETSCYFPKQKENKRPARRQNVKHNKENSKQSNSKEQNNVPDENQSSSSMDSDSDSSCDSESSVELWDKSSDDELPVINTGLNVEEILGLKMGGNEGNTAEKANIACDKSRDRVFENSVNVSEILNLESGCYDDASVVDVKESFSNSDRSVMDANKDGKLEASTEMEVDYSNEGGFIRDNDDDGHSKGILQATEDSKSKPRKVKTVTFKLEAVVGDETGSDNTNIGIDTNNKTEFAKDSDQTKGTRSSKQQELTSNFNNIELKTDENNKTECTQNKSVMKEENGIWTDCKSEPQVTGRSTRRKVKPSIYADDPLQPEVKGVPWAGRGRGRRKTAANKGLGKNILPAETVVKRTKLNAPGNKGKRNLVDGPNLSESDSD